MSTILPRHIARHAATLLAAITFTAIIAAPTTSAWADDSQNAKETACTKAVTAINDAVSAAVSSYVDQHALTKEAFAALPAADDAPQAFALAGDETPNLSSDGLAQIQSASAALTDDGHPVSFLFVDLSTGHGIAYHLDTRVYGASSFKGPYAAYLAETKGDALSSSTRALIESMVLVSDNNAFASLRNSYDSDGFTGWLSDQGVDSAIAHDTHFPRYSARESALLWLSTYHYLQKGSATAQWLKGLYGNTNISMIRSGVADTGATIYNKAGWCASGERFSGVCDAGLIECDGTTYLMSVMTGAPDSGTHQAQVAALARTLFDQRSSLA